MKVSLVIPAYNEEESIGETLQEIKEVMGKSKHDYELIVVDDGSDDATGKILREVEGIKVITHTTNYGYGASLKDGIRKAHGEWILITDADGTYPPAEIPKLLKFLDSEDYEMVVGSRTGKQVHIPLYRKPAKWFLAKLANYLSGSKIPDLNSGLRLFRKETALEFFHLLPSGFSFTTTITLAYLSNDYPVKYLPIDYLQRGGQSKIKPFRDGFNFILLIIRTIMYFNPLKVFIPVSILLFLAAVFIFCYSWLILDRVMDISVILLVVTSIQILILGLIADLIIKRGKK